MMMPRVWDKFLSDADRAALAKAPPRPHLRRGLGERPALLLIDLYRAVFGDRRQPLTEALERWPSSCGPAAWDALPHIQTLLAACRQADLPIVHVTALADSAIEEWAKQGRLDLDDGTRARLRETSAERYAIIDDVAPLPNEAVLQKTAPSAFWGTPLVAHLNAHRVDSLIVCGESTSGCVRATVVEARTHRYNVVVVEDCVFDRHEAPHAINLFDMHQKYADVLSLDDTLQLLAERRTPAVAAT